MPVPSSINDLSTTADSNYPQGTEPALPLMDNHIRQIYAFLALLRDNKLTTSSVSAFIQTLFDDADAATARATLGAVAKAGDTMTGPLVLPGNASSALQAVPKQQLDAKADLAGSAAQAFSVSAPSAPAHAVPLASFDAVLSTNGYQKLPSGLILQWGQESMPEPPATGFVTFPMAFPSFCASVTIGSGMGASSSVLALVKSTSGFSVYLDEWIGRTNAGPICWMAVGW